jgi:hypothetical protein
MGTLQSVAGGGLQSYFLISLDNTPSALSKGGTLGMKKSGVSEGSLLDTKTLQNYL